jgi:hypothetical protein
MHNASKILTIGLLITTMPMHAATAASTKAEYYDCFFSRSQLILLLRELVMIGWLPRQR